MLILALALLPVTLGDGPARSLAPPAALPLVAPGRVLLSGELAGMPAEGAPETLTSLRRWLMEADPCVLVRSERGWALEFDALREAGWASGLVQRFAGTQDARGRSTVAEVRSAAAASGHVARCMAATAAWAEDEPEWDAEEFVVDGIPGARGITLSGPGFVAHTVAFAQGPYFHAVSAYFQADTTASRAARADVLASALVLYERVA